MERSIRLLHEGPAAGLHVDYRDELTEPNWRTRLPWCKGEIKRLRCLRRALPYQKRCRLHHSHKGGRDGVADPGEYTPALWWGDRPRRRQPRGQCHGLFRHHWPQRCWQDEPLQLHQWHLYADTRPYPLRRPRYQFLQTPPTRAVEDRPYVPEYRPLQRDDRSR